MEKQPEDAAGLGGGLAQGILKWKFCTTDSPAPLKLPLGPERQPVRPDASPDAECSIICFTHHDDGHLYRTTPVAMLHLTLSDKK